MKPQLEIATCLFDFFFRSCLLLWRGAKNKEPKKGGTLSREIEVPTGTARSADPLLTNGPMLIKL